MSHMHHPIETETHDTIVERDAGAGMGMVLGLVLVVLLIGAVLWVAFAGVGVPATGGGQGGTTINNNSNPPANTGPNITVPRNIDINVNPPPNNGGAQAPSDGSGQ
jgi:hypothetical protein